MWNWVKCKSGPCDAGLSVREVCSRSCVIWTGSGKTAGNKLLTDRQFEAIVLSWCVCNVWKLQIHIDPLVPLVSFSTCGEFWCLIIYHKAALKRDRPPCESILKAWVDWGSGSNRRAEFRCCDCFEGSEVHHSIALLLFFMKPGSAAPWFTHICSWYLLWNPSIYYIVTT